MYKYNETTIYYVWLQQALGYGNPKVRTIFNFYKDIKEFYYADYTSKRMLGCFTSKELSNLKDTSLDKSMQIIEDCKTLDYNIITFNSDDYPKCLSEIYNPPIVLYVKGEMPNVDYNLSIGIVGTRSASRQGIRTAFTFGAELSKVGTIVVSGGALGVDCAAHRGVLQSGGSTICVLGCGIDYNYLSSNAQMRNLITKKGAVISEYPPKSPPLGRNFPMRNRIISGLSNGLVVIEAGEKSGSLITANLALEQNRDVFSVPGEITNTYQLGTNLLIKQGAKFTTEVKDILEEYDDLYTQYIETTSEQNLEDYEEEIDKVPFTVRKEETNNEKTDNKKEKTTNNSDKVKTDNQKLDTTTNYIKTDIPDDISDDAKMIYDVLSEMPVHTDEIASKTKLSIKNVLTALTQLELFGLIKSHSGRRFSK